MNGPMTADQFGQWVMLLIVVGVIALLYYRKPWRPSASAHGTASFATEQQMKWAGMLKGSGLLLGRMLGKAAHLLYIPRYVHLAIFAPAGAGKAVSFAVPWLLTWNRGSVVVLDPKGELWTKSHKKREAMGQRVVRLDPFGVCGPGGNAFNPLDLIDSGPECSDDARALAEAMVVRTGEEKDPHWNDQAANVITAILAYILANFSGAERSLASLREIITTPGMYAGCATALQAMGGVFARLAGVLLSLEDKEKAGVLSTVNRHTTFLDSPAVGPAVASGWNARAMLAGDAAVYLVLPPHQLEAQSRWLRLVISSLLRLVGRETMRGKEALFLLDEAGQLGRMQPIEQGLTLLRAAGLRLVLMYQSLGQLHECWKEKKEVVLDNTDQLYFGAQAATAKTISERIGNYTETASSYSENEGTSRQYGSFGQQGQGVTVTSGSNVSVSVHSRALLTPDEIERLPPICMIAFLRCVSAPVICRRILYYEDPLFKKPSWLQVVWHRLMVAAFAIITILASLQILKWVQHSQQGASWQHRNSNPPAFPEGWPTWPPQP